MRIAPLLRSSLLFLGLLATGILLGDSGPAAAEDKPGKLGVYIGTYTASRSKGIYYGLLDLSTGKLTMKGVAAEAANPSFLAIDPSRRYLYAVNEISTLQGQKTGGVSAFAINSATGELTLLNQQPAGGTGPCHLVVDRQGKNVLVANYGGGSIASLPIGSDGKLAPAVSVIQHTGSSVNPQRQKEPHAHSINLDAANRFAFAADLGLDKVLVYRFDPASGKLSPNDPPAGMVAPGSGPRHFAFHPGGKYAYVINELANTVTAFAYDAEKGTLKEIQSITTLPSDFKGTSYTAEVVVHPSGNFLYGSNRGHNSIAAFAIDQGTGKLTAISHQAGNIKTPRNFAVDPTGQYLLVANQDGDSIVVFRINQKSGDLEPTGQVVDVPRPVCIRMIPVPTR